MTDPLGENTRPLTPEQIADRWDCSARLVVRQCQEGKLKHFRVGRHYRITPAALLAFEAQSASPAGVNETEEQAKTRRANETAEGERLREAIRLARRTK